MGGPLKRLTFFLLLALALITGACEFRFPGDVEPETGEVLFQDDFSDPDSGWDRLTAPNGETNYLNGVYRIYVNQPSTDVIASPGLEFSDTIIEVDAAKIGGPDDNDFGIACRVQDKTHYYFFLISSDGYYGVGQYTDQGQQLIGMPAMLPSEIIQQGQAINHIRADCVANRLALYVNGERLIEITDDTYASGDVGLVAGSFGTPGTDIHFDNFVVTKP